MFIYKNPEGLEYDGSLNQNDEVVEINGVNVLGKTAGDAIELLKSDSYQSNIELKTRRHKKLIVFLSNLK